MSTLSWLIISIVSLIVGYGLGYLIAQLNYTIFDDDEDRRDD